MKRIVLYIIISLVILLPASARSTFRTAELERLAKELALDIDALPDGYSHPIVNDVKYGGKRTDPAVFQGYFEIPEGTGVSKMPVNERSICLSAYSLSFIHPADGKKREYSIEEPAFY